MPVTDAELIHFDCPHCSQSIAADSGDAGRSVGCPTCDQPMVVPPHHSGKPVPTRSETLPLADQLADAWEERTRLVASLESTQATCSALHAQLQTALQTETALRSQLAEVEALRSHDHSLAAEKASLAAAADSELRIALGTARGQIEVLRSERDALKAALDIAQKSSIGAEEQATERILAARRQATAAEAARDELAQKGQALESEVRALRTQLTQDTGGRELLALRDRVRELSESYESKSVALAQATESLETQKRANDALQKQLSESLLRAADLERKAEEVSATNLQADNEVLRGLVKRQKALCKRQNASLIALRSARLFLRTVQSVGLLFVLSIAALALDALPESIKLMIRTWLGIP